MRSRSVENSSKQTDNSLPLMEQMAVASAIAAQATQTATDLQRDADLRSRSAEFSYFSGQYYGEPDKILIHAEFRNDGGNAASDLYTDLLYAGEPYAIQSGGMKKLLEPEREESLVVFGVQEINSLLWRISKIPLSYSLQRQIF